MSQMKENEDEKNDLINFIFVLLEERQKKGTSMPERETSERENINK